MAHEDLSLTVQEYQQLLRSGDYFPAKRMPSSGGGWRAIMGTPPKDAIYSPPVIEHGSDGSARIITPPQWVV